MMELVYRTLQRPEVDVLAWTPSNITAKAGGRVLHFRQSKTGRLVDIALVGRLDELVRKAIGEVPQLRQPIVHDLAGEAYTYDGISSMLRLPEEGGRRLVRLPRPEGQGRDRHVAERRADRADPAALRPRRQDDDRDLHQGAVDRNCAAECVQYPVVHRRSSGVERLAGDRLLLAAARCRTRLHAACSSIRRSAC
jgi:hypothetical protein